MDMKHLTPCCLKNILPKGIIQAYKSGVPLLGNSTSTNRWDYTGSFFFSVTAITTIGYGNLAPNTSAGQIFCVFFALFGIPLNLILLNRIGQKMLGLVQKSTNFLGKKLGRRKAVKFLTSSCALVIGLLLFFFLPPILFRAMEGWTYEEGFYYAFITLSTIGFGDYVVGQVPGKDYPNWYRNIVSLWILFGLAWLALIITLSINLLESARNYCPCCQRKEDEKRDVELIDTSLNGQGPTPLQGPEDTDSASSTSRADSPQ
ncbi:potassium channel subfamily K member 17 isoform X2 [Dendropsophus ebraccatus]|uniref:potassium channel subfamily K member 17 isoform X2 n=1 Tax=Dendropsophus ebraccatus TaxID=150705 RepID=UPI003831412C